MPIIILLVALIVLKYFAIWRFADMSWWWPIGVACFGFMWFEFIEPMLGLDKRKAHDEQDKIRKERLAQTFNKTKKRK